MTISIIIPIYNVAPYVEQCLQSVADQTYQGEMECLLVDDCGTDESMDICERFIASYNGTISFRIIHHEHNRGLSAARNTGIDNAVGDWVFFLDSDDWLIPYCIDKMVAMVERYPDVQLVQGGFKKTDGDTWLSIENKSLPEYTEDRHLIKIDLLGKERVPVMAQNRLVSLDFIRHEKLYFQEGFIHEDNLWTNLLAKKITRMSVLPVDTYYYRIHNGSIMGAEGNLRAKNYLKIYHEMIETIDDLYRDEQVKRIHNLLLNIYNFTTDLEIRKKIGEDERSLALKSDNWFLKNRLLLCSFLTCYDKGDNSLGYYCHYHFSKGDLS